MLFRSKSDDENAGYEITKELLKSKNPPTAIACFNDLIAVGAQSAINESKSDISIVGYDNTYLSGLSQIDITTIDPGNREIADISANLIMGENIDNKQLYLSKPKLIIRSSSKKLKKSKEK